MADYTGYIGYFKYEGKSVSDGLLDARKSGEALIGFDEALRHFLREEGVEGAEFEIPVRIRKGSWEALIPTAVFVSVSLIGTAYLSQAAQTIAANDFKGKSSADLVKGALKRVQSTITLAKHLGGIASRDIKGVTWLDKNRIVSIPNKEGRKLDVTSEELKSYLSCPPQLLSKMTSIVERERVLKVGRIENGTAHEVEITEFERDIFYNEPELIQEILPELKDGQIVTISGMITRGNRKTNGIGIEYKDHILNCRPESGTVVQYKQYLFTRCELRGVVDRQTNGMDKKPQIIILQINSLEQESNQESMF